MGVIQQRKQRKLKVKVNNKFDETGDCNALDVGVLRCGSCCGTCYRLHRHCFSIMNAFLVLLLHVLLPNMLPCVLPLVLPLLLLLLFLPPACCQTIATPAVAAAALRVII